MISYISFNGKFLRKFSLRFILSFNMLRARLEDEESNTSHISVDEDSLTMTEQGDNAQRARTMHIQACLKPASIERLDKAKSHIEKYLRSNYVSLPLHTLISDFSTDDWMDFNVEFVRICEGRGSDENILQLSKCEIIAHVYSYQNHETKHVETNEDEDDNDKYDTGLSKTITDLPSKNLEGLW